MDKKKKKNNGLNMFRKISGTEKQREKDGENLKTDVFLKIKINNKINKKEICRPDQTSRGSGAGGWMEICHQG